MHTSHSLTDSTQVQKQTWPPPAISVKEPRLVRISDQANGYLNCSKVGLGLFTILGTWLTVLEGDRIAELNENGIVTTGQVVDHKRVGDDGTEYRVTNRYSVGQDTYSISENVSAKVFDSISTGSTSFITYPLRNPERGVVGKMTDKAVSQSQAIYGLVIAACCAVFGTLLILLKRQIRDQLQILAHWDAHTMRVTKITSSQDKDNSEEMSTLTTISMETEFPGLWTSRIQISRLPKRFLRFSFHRQDSAQYRCPIFGLRPS